MLGYSHRSIYPFKTNESLFFLSYLKQIYFSCFCKDPKLGQCSLWNCVTVTLHNRVFFSLLSLSGSQLGSMGQLFSGQVNRSAVGVEVPQNRQCAKLFLQSSELGLPQPLTRRRNGYGAGSGSTGSECGSGYGKWCTYTWRRDLLQCHTYTQCWGSVTFWRGSGTDSFLQWLKGC